MTENIEQDVWQWVDEVIIGLNLCPFAKKPRKNAQIKMVISEAKSDEDKLREFEHELVFLRDVDPSLTDTSLVVYPQGLEDFNTYLDWLYFANMTLQQLGLEGEFQLASFHPNYQFDGAEPEDKENLTNRSPYPVIHIIREATVEKVLKQYPDPESIPENNIKRVEELSESEVERLFPYL